MKAPSTTTIWWRYFSENIFRDKKKQELSRSGSQAGAQDPTRDWVDDQNYSWNSFCGELIFFWADFLLTWCFFELIFFRGESSSFVVSHLSQHYLLVIGLSSNISPWLLSSWKVQIELRNAESTYMFQVLDLFHNNLCLFWHYYVSRTFIILVS